MMWRKARRRAFGFTLVELMIAVLVLVVVIVATSKIFGTVGKVTSLGQATADVLQEAAAIERQIRSDFERLAPNGVFAIRCVSVANDLNVLTGGPLLNPALPPDAMIRSDQLLFFTNGVQSIQTYRQGSGSTHKGQATAARIYYGHAFQLPEARKVDEDQGNAQQVSAHDPIVDINNPLVPWYSDSTAYDMVWTTFSSTADGSDYTTVNAGSINANQPLAPEWLLARQAVVLADDGGSPDVYLAPPLQEGGNRSAPHIGPDVIRNGRVDAAASQLNDIRTAIVGDGTVLWNPDQRNFISSDLLFYPRAERVAPGMHRVDQALTNNVLAGACSSFIVDWTYEEGVGAAFNDQGFFFDGFGVDTDPGTGSPEHPWFGLDSDVDQNNIPDRGVYTYDGSVWPFQWWTGATTIDPANIEQYNPPNTQGGGAIQDTGAVVYEAIFGYNRDRPFDNLGNPDSALGYTPWPSSIRITMVLHDSDTKLEVGREIQFVINLPSRVE